MTSLNPTDNEEEGLGLDLKKTVARFIDHWKLFLFFFLLAIACAYLYLKITTPIYKVNATLMIQDPDKGGNLFSSTSNVLSDFGDMFGSKSSVDNEAQILQTSDLTLKVARDLKLYISYFRQERFKKVELYTRSPFELTVLSPIDSIRGSIISIKPVIRNNRITLDIKEKGEDGDSTYTANLDQPFTTYAGDSIFIRESGIPVNEKEEYVIALGPLAKAATDMGKSLSVDIPNKQVSTINVQISNSLRDKGVDVLRTMISEYIHGNITQKNAFADSTIGFINDRISIVNHELSGIEKEVQTFQEVNKIADIKEQAIQVIDNENDNQKDLTNAEVQKQIVEQAIKYLQDEHNNRRPVPSLLASPDPTFLLLLDKYNALQIQADRMSLGNTDQNPMVMNLNNQIANLRKDLLTNLENQLTGINIGLQKLEDKNNQVNSFIQSAPEKQRQYIGLAREQDIKQALFIYLLQKKEEVAVTKASNISSCVVIDAPKAAELPSSPKRSIILFIALLAGIAIPYGILLIGDMLNNKISGTQDLATTGVISLGEVGHNPEGSPLVFHDKARSIIAEQFRALRTNLQFALGEVDCPVILITSSMSGEGKSFISTNLALAYASNGKKVLLMELDLRKPKISQALSIHWTKGFSNYIASNTDLCEIIYSTDISPDLKVLVSGPIPPNPSELLSHPKTKAMLDQLKRQYDIIIIDSAPIGLVTDAQILAPLMDISLYIVRQNYTFKQQTNIIRDLAQSGKMPKLYTIVNDTRPKTSSRYGYNDGSAYGYGYGYGGYAEPEKNGWWRKLTKSN